MVEKSREEKLAAALGLHLECKSKFINAWYDRRSREIEIQGSGFHGYLAQSLIRQRVRELWCKGSLDIQGEPYFYIRTWIDIKGFEISLMEYDRYNPEHSIKDFDADTAAAAWEETMLWLVEERREGCVKSTD